MLAAELQLRLSAIDPDVLLVSPRLLRRVVRETHQVTALRVPHRHLVLLPADRLLSIVSTWELGLSPQRNLSGDLLLLPDDLGPGPEAQILLRYSRLLFHGQIHRHFSQLRLDDKAVADRLDRLGRAEVAEARDVLRQEALLVDDRPATLYEEFAALYLELRAFDPQRLHEVFPSCLEPARVEAVFVGDVDAEALATRCRLPGAATLTPHVEAEPVISSDDADSRPADSLWSGPDDADKAGNLVRAALLQQRATPGSAAATIERLTHRLLTALELPGTERAGWNAAVLALLEPAVRGYWNVESRLLYDLQKVCLDLEKPVFAADLVEYLLTLGQRPVKRPLPDLPLVLALTHLRTAEKHLTRARLDEDQRRRFAQLLQHAVHHLEERMRRTLRPKIALALDEAGLLARGAAEQLSRSRLIEELLDRIVSIGALTLGDLRDAVARSRLKLPDLPGPGDFIWGDPLLRANENLARSLDGIARRGEIYLRWMQSFSSLFFGTVIGRFLTLFLLLPLLASLFTLKGLDALIGEVGHVVEWVENIGHEYTPVGDGGEMPPEFAVEKQADILFNVYSFAGLAVFFLLVFHVGWWREGVLKFLYWIVWVPLRGILYDGPRAILSFPPLRAILASHPFQLFLRLVGRPLFLTFPIVIGAYLLSYIAGLTYHWSELAVVCGVWFVLMAILINTKWGRSIEERLSEGAGRAWELFHRDFLGGVIGVIQWFFRALGDRLERWRYSVDERLRFRQGDSSSSFVSKLIVGLFWFLLVYLVRMIVILLVEPQINPIKHFPIVTVSHKLSLLAIEPVSTATGISAYWVTAILGLIPGIFGFLAWELKENWRLYRANASPDIEPEMIGSHGEHLINYIRPGFHSGTLPLAFSTLRRARGSGYHHARKQLHHVEEELRRFVEREFAATLAAHPDWANRPVKVGAIRLATNRVRIELVCSGGRPTWMEFENVEGHLVATIPTPQWGEGREALDNALLGLMKRCGVDRLNGDDTFAATVLRWEDWAAWCERRNGRLMNGITVTSG